MSRSAVFHVMSYWLLLRGSCSCLHLGEHQRSPGASSPAGGVTTTTPATLQRHYDTARCLQCRGSWGWGYYIAGQWWCPTFT